MRMWLQHRFNELSLYCRFKDLGVSARSARRLSRFLGRLLNLLLYGWGR